MAVPLGIEAFPCARTAVTAGVLTVICGASPVSCRMFDGLPADNGANWLLRIAGGFVAMPSVVVPQLGGVIAAVSRTVPPLGRVVAVVGSSVTFIGRAVPSVCCASARSVAAARLVLNHVDAPACPECLTAASESQVATAAEAQMWAWACDISSSGRHSQLFEVRATKPEGIRFAPLLLPGWSIGACVTPVCLPVVGHRRSHYR